MTNPIRTELNDRHILYETLFSQFQSTCPSSREKYINSEGFQDVKIIFDLYSKTYQFKGFNTNNLTEDKLNKLLKEFDVFKQKDLISFLIERLKIEGNNSHAEDFEKMLKKKQIHCCGKNILIGKDVFFNFCSIVQKCSSYNIFTLAISLIVFVLISMGIFSPAPCEFMEVLHITKINISQDAFLNHLSNVLLYTFDFDDTMKIVPLDIVGVVVIIVLRIFMLLIIVNFLVKEFINRFKI